MLSFLRNLTLFGVWNRLYLREKMGKRFGSAGRSSAMELLCLVLIAIVSVALTSLMIQSSLASSEDTSKERGPLDPLCPIYVPLILKNYCALPAEPVSPLRLPLIMKEYEP